jgi:transposase-like protein
MFTSINKCRGEQMRRINLHEWHKEIIQMVNERVPITRVAKAFSVNPKTVYLCIEKQKRIDVGE